MYPNSRYRIDNTIDEGFMKKAPAFKIEEEKRKLTDYEKQLSAVTERLAFLRK